MSKAERVRREIVFRLAAGECVMSGNNRRLITDLAIDLRRARTQRDRYLSQKNQLRKLIAYTVTAARSVIYELAGREIANDRIVTKRMNALVGKGTKPGRRGMGGPKRKVKHESVPAFLGNPMEVA